MCEGRKAQRLWNWKWLSTDKQTVYQKKNSSESPGSSEVKGRLCFFLHTCTLFKTSKNANAGPPSLGGSFLEDVSQPWLTSIWSSFSHAFSASCYRLLSVHLPGCAGVQFWQHRWDCLIQIPPSQVHSSWEPGLKTVWRHTFPPSFRSAITTRLSTSIGIFEDCWGAGPLTGGLGHVVTMICSRPMLMCSLISCWWVGGSF